VYSIPDYALRFAAHCRSRLKYLEANVPDAARVAAAAGSARIWIRFAPHEARANLKEKCIAQRARDAA
jgi:hypothetical protein